MTITQWLDTPPTPEEIKEKDGGLYIPYHIIVEKLNYLCHVLSKGVWHSRDFHHYFFTLKNGKTIVSGEINLVVNYDGVDRWLAGAATFALSKTSNPHPAATVKSLAIMNAVKPLGKQFGWGLNGFESESAEMPTDLFLIDTVPTETTFNDREVKVISAIGSCASVEELSALKKDLPPSLMSLYMNKLKELTKKISVNGQ